MARMLVKIAKLIRELGPVGVSPELYAQKERADIEAYERRRRLKVVGEDHGADSKGGRL